MGEIAVPISLHAWQDPQGDVILKHSRSLCAVYFGCWTNAGEPADYICELQFEHARQVRGHRSEHLSYQAKQGLPRFGVYKIEDSTWLRQASEQRLTDYPNWRDWDAKQYTHYVVQGHDNYYELLATGFTEKRLPYEEAGELQRLIGEA